MATLFSAFLLVSPNVKAANFTDNQTVDSNKTWTVKFTDEVGFDDVTKQGITVTDSKGTAANVGIQLGQDNKIVTVTAPQVGYIAGESYILNVGTKAHSNNGKALKNEYKVHFNIKNNVPTAVDLTTITCSNPIDNFSTAVEVKLNVTDPQDYTVKVKGIDTVFNAAKGIFLTIVDEKVLPTDLKSTDFVVAKKDVTCYYYNKSR